jgi:hypothetical protein
MNPTKPHQAAVSTASALTAGLLLIQAPSQKRITKGDVDGGCSRDTTRRQEQLWIIGNKYQNGLYLAFEVIAALLSVFMSLKHG